MAAEPDLMKGIDDKFQKLLSQFEMNMNILELKSKRQYLSDDERSDTTQTVTEYAEPREESSHKKTEKNRDENAKNERKEQKKNVTTGESITETNGSTTQEAESPRLAITKGQSVKKDFDKEQNANNPDSIGNILKFISDCAEIKSKKNKRKKKNISFTSFAENEPVISYNSDDSNKSQRSNRIAQKVKKSGAKKSPYGSEQMSKHGSKTRSDRENLELLRKCSKTVTNLSKKGKKRKATRNNGSGKDWISYNRNNIAKTQKALKTIKILPKVKDNANVQLSKRAVKKQDNTISTDKEQKSVGQVKAAVEHFETVENKLIKDLFNSDLSELKIKKEKNQINRFTIRDKTGFNKPVKPLKESNGNNSFVNVDKNRNNKTAEIKNIPEKKMNNNEKVIPWQNMLRGRDLIKKPNEERPQKFSAKSVSSDIPKAQKSEMIISKLEDKKSAISNLETKVQKERYKDHKMELEITKPKNELKITSKFLNEFGDEEEQGDSGDVKVELDEFFSEIPFVVGKSISRTYNLGLSFQHAMSLLRRMHNKKDVTSALSLGHPESVAGTESIHCLGLAHCEAMVNSDWTKEDDEAWEENPWDPELNRRRPKCTCLPNNCTTLKNVLKQLTLKNPSFGRKNLQPSLSATSNKNLEAELFKKNALKKAQSQTRTELLRNIRTIQIQLTPSSEILK